MNNTPRVLVFGARDLDATRFAMEQDHYNSIECCRGALNKWKTELNYSEKIRDCDADTVAHALLACTENLVVQAKAGDKSCEAELRALCDQDIPNLANSVIQFDHPVMRRRWFPQKNQDSSVHIPYLRHEEADKLVNQCSAWTLSKAFKLQVIAAVDRLFDRRMSGLPLVATAPKKVTSTAAMDREPRPTCRTPEDALWNDVATEHLSDIVRDLIPTYHEILKLNLNFADHYRFANYLRRSNRLAEQKSDNSVQSDQSGKTRQRQNNSNRRSNPGQSRVSVSN